MEKGISYINRTFNDYKNSLLNYTKQYYPELEEDFNDASIGSWLLDVVANIGDNLSYHIDRVYQETNLESANELESVYSIARSNNVKIPGPKAAMTEVVFTCELPVDSKSKTSSMDNPDWSYAPVIKKGTKVSSGNEIFELLDDVDFNEQFNKNGISDRLMVPKRNSRGIIDRYVISKTGMVYAGETKIFTRVLRSSDITPFMSFIIPDNNVMDIESIIVKDGTNHNNTPTMSEFLYPHESNIGKDDCNGLVKLWRFFEVDYLAQQYQWGDYSGEVVKRDENENTHEYYIRKGAWNPVRQKFITEFTNKGQLKVIFGAGNENLKNIDYSQKYKDVDLITRIINNDGLGVLPKPDTTLYIMYKKGGGANSNVAEGAINNIYYLNTTLRGVDTEVSNNIKRSINVTNQVPGVSGRDMMSADEIKYLIKYNNGAQDRCVTLKDYYDRIAKLPSRYGCPFRYGITEENNKIMIYTLGLNSEGKLTDVIPSILLENLKNYLSGYKMINDYIEIKPGRYINLQFEIEIFVDKNYNTSDVVANIVECVKNYMDINKNQMGDDIFVGDIEKEISKIDGVSNLISLEVFNVYGYGYSNNKTMQSLKEISSLYLDPEIGENINPDEYADKDCIDLKMSDKMLFSENDTMFEIRYPENDIICRCKQR